MAKRTNDKKAAEHNRHERDAQEEETKKEIADENIKAQRSSVEREEYTTFNKYGRIRRYSATSKEAHKINGEPLFDQLLLALVPAVGTGRLGNNSNPDSTERWARRNIRRFAPVALDKIK